MKVIIAESSGFCWGVKRAMDMAFKYVEKKSNVVSLREIIHNPHEVKRLEKAGAKHVGKTSELKKGSNAIISAHGITPAEKRKVERISSDVLDTTCPYVKKIHNIVEKLGNDGYRIVIIGDKDHYEVKGIRGYADENGPAKSYVIGSVAQAKKFKPGIKTGVVAQTTMSFTKFREIVSVIEDGLVKRNSEIRIFNTICDATQKRQEAAVELAKKVDIMIVIGGKNSANTKRLYELSRDILEDVYHVEDSSEIKKAWFKGKKTAGISAGASTPETAIIKTVEKIKKY